MSEFQAKDVAKSIKSRSDEDTDEHLPMFNVDPNIYAQPTPIPYRPAELPEPVDPHRPLPKETDEAAKNLAYLPPLPYPYTDILWRSDYDRVLETTQPLLFDFLAADKAKLRERQPLSMFDKNTKDESSWQTFKVVLREIGETLLLTIIIFFLIQSVIRNFRVVGTSMVNNLQDGQYLIIDKLSYSWLFTDILEMGGIQRGDVIVFEPPTRPDDDYVKRIIGLPGETVEVVDGQVFINGALLDEPFKPRIGSYDMPPVTVGEDEVFVLGDNRNNSNDSHNWGTLPQANIVGRAWISYWPPQEWGTIPRDRPSDEATLFYIIDALVPSANAEESTTP